MIKIKTAPFIFLCAIFVTTAVCSGFGQTQGETATAVNILWYMRGKGPEKDEALIEQAANKYLKDKINATIKIVCFDRASYEQKITAIIASGEVFDICFTASWTNNYLANVARGAFVPLNDPANDLMSKYAPKTREVLGKDFFAGSAVKGINYAIPVNKEKATNMGFLLRKDILDKYGLNVSTLKTLADIEPMLKTVSEKEPAMKYPFGAVVTNEYPLMYVLGWQKPVDDLVPVVMYGDPYKKDTKVYFSLEQPIEQQHFDLMRKWYTAGYIRKDAATVDDYTIDFKAGKVFCRVGGLKPGAADEWSATYGNPWVQKELWPYALMTTGDAMGAMQAISRTSKNPTRALMFLEIMNTDKYMCNLINYGIENVHYVKVSDNVIQYAPGTNEGKNSGYNPQMQWGFANQFLTYLFPNENPKKWANYEALNKTALPAISMGFVFDQEPVKNEVAACKNVWQEYMPGLVTGSVDPKVVLPKAIAKFREAGVDKLVKEAQKQFDAWYAARPK
jgi:putative aldouronate transport system substrate-binding protein